MIRSLYISSKLTICMFVIAFDSLFLRPKVTLTWKIEKPENGALNRRMLIFFVNMKINRRNIDAHSLWKQEWWTIFIQKSKWYFGAWLLFSGLLSPPPPLPFGFWWFFWLGCSTYVRHSVCFCWPLLFLCRLMTVSRTLFLVSFLIKFLF